MDEFFLADDLSGALDAGAAFLHAGRSVRIVLGRHGWDLVQPDEVVGYTTETRNSEPHHAADVVRSALEIARARGRRLVYKKIDSTLRGPVAAELLALMETLPGTRVLFAPANPKVGRTVEHGRLLVRGVPVAETEFARDPSSPLRESAIRMILGPAASARVSIPDTVTEDALFAAAREMDTKAGDWVAIGSGALAAVAAERIAGSGAGGVTPVPEFGPGILMVSGSAHPLNRQQASYLADAQRISVREVGPAGNDPTIAAVSADVKRTGAAAVCAPAIRIEPGAALRAIVDAATAIIRDTDVRRVFVTGGETAFALSQRLGIRTLRLMAEVEPGLVVAAGETSAGAALQFAVKPGGFGDTQTWIRAWEHLRRG